MKLTLKEWNEQYFKNHARSDVQLWRYIKNGQIHPRPIKVGRGYIVESTAILLTKDSITNHNLLMERINESKKRIKN